WERCLTSLPILLEVRFKQRTTGVRIERFNKKGFRRIFDPVRFMLLLDVNFKSRNTRATRLIGARTRITESRTIHVIHTTIHIEVIKVKVRAIYNLVNIIVLSTQVINDKHIRTQTMSINHRILDVISL